MFKLSSDFYSKMQSGLSPFLVNIIPLQNIQSNTSGLDTTTQLSNTVDGLVQMVNFEQKRIYADSISSYSPDASIQVLSPMNLNGVNITGGGSILVNGDGTTTGSFNSLVVDASGTFGGIVYAAGFVTLSDERRKREIQLFDSSRLASLDQLHAWTYNLGSGAKEIGLIAQEIQPLFPEVVHSNQEGDLMVNYQEMIPVLLEAIKDLRARVRYLECVKNT